MVQRLLLFGSLLLVIFAGVAVLWDSEGPSAPVDEPPAAESAAPPAEKESSPPPAVTPPEREPIVIPVPPPAAEPPPPPAAAPPSPVSAEDAIPALPPAAETIQLVFLYPEQRPIAAQVFLAHAESGRFIELSLRRPDVESADSIALPQALERGGWRLLARSAPAAGAAPSPGWVAEAEISLPGKKSLEVAFAPGAILRVVARGRAGGAFVPLAGARVSISPKGWHAAGRKWLYEATTGADGVAIFSGLPRHAALVTSLDPGREVSSEAGSVEIEKME